MLGSFVNGEFVLDESKLQQAIAEFKVGSVLNAPGPVAQTAAKWQGDNRSDSGSFYERNRYSLYLRIRSDSWYYLYIGWYPFPTEYQYSSFV